MTQPLPETLNLNDALTRERLHMAMVSAADEVIGRKGFVADADGRASLAPPVQAALLSEGVAVTSVEVGEPIDGQVWVRAGLNDAFDPLLASFNLSAVLPSEEG